MSLLLLLGQGAGGGPAPITGTAVQGATAGQVVAQGAEGFSGSGVVAGRAAPVVAQGAEGFSGTGVAVGAVGVVLASGTQVSPITGTGVVLGQVGQVLAEGTVPYAPPVTNPSTLSYLLGFAGEEERHPEPAPAISGEGGGQATAGQVVAVGQVVAPVAAPRVEAPSAPVEVVRWGMTGSLWVPGVEEELESVALALLEV